jgi:hypothetical protein
MSACGRYHGVIASYNPDTHLHTVYYDEGATEEIKLPDEGIEIISGPKARRQVERGMKERGRGRVEKARGGIKGSNHCEHGRRHSCCKECGGASICEHGRMRSQCKECGGASICEHGRIRNTCKECGGASICEHGRIRSTCKECGGAGICEHGRTRSQCKEEKKLGPGLTTMSK